MHVPDEVIGKYSEDGVVIMKHGFGPEWTGKLNKGLKKFSRPPHNVAGPGTETLKVEVVFATARYGWIYPNTSNSSSILPVVKLLAD